MLDENIAKAKKEAETPGTQAYATRQAQLKKDADAAALAARPAMTFPDGPKPSGLVGASTAKAIALLGKNAVPNQTGASLDTGAGTIKVEYVKGIVTAYEIDPKNFAAVRDKSELRTWLQLPTTSEPFADGKLNGHFVRLQFNDVGATVHVADAEVAADRIAAKQAAANEAKEQRDALATGRRETASLIQDLMREHDMAAIVTVRGDANNTLVIKWLGCGEISLDMLVNSDWFVPVERKQNFKRVECSDTIEQIFSVSY